MSEKERSQFPQQPTQVELERSPATIDGMAGSKALPASTAIPGVNSVKEIRFKPASEDSPNGFFDSINGSNVTTIQMPQAMPLIARGWAILPEEGRAADKVIITYGWNNNLVAVAPLNLERPDIVKVFDNPAYRNCGWSVTLNPAIPIGKVVLKAWAYNSARKEATRLNSSSSQTRVRRSISRLRYLYSVVRLKGMRFVLAKLSQKLYRKFNDPQQSLDFLPVFAERDAPYYKWLVKNFPREADLQKMAETVEIFSYKPVISVIMPVFNPPKHFLVEAIESVLKQVYPYWELCIADDASTAPHVRPVLEEYASKDARIKVVFRNENGHISRASNSAIEVATGEFVALLDHDDLLTADALYEVALLLNRYPHADVIYSDEDKVDESNQLKDPFFKPDWCPDSFLSRMYTCHLGTYRRSLVTEIGGFRVGYEGSQDYDLVLRLTEQTKNIFHIPKILYHWRIHHTSTANKLTNKNYAVGAAKKALSEALTRRKEPGVVISAPGANDYYLVRYEITNYDLVSIIIPTRNLGNTLDNCLLSIFEKTTYTNYEIILIDNGSTEIATLDVIKKWQNREPNRFRCYPLDISFNYPKLNNFAVSHAKGKYLLFLNNDTEVIAPDWIDAMTEQAQRPSIGAVGALLLYPDDTIQHAGVVAGVGGVAGHSHKHFKVGSQGYFNYINTVNNFSAVTAACMMCRRDLFAEVRGFEEELASAFNDIDFCLKLVEKGYRNVYLPHVILYHYESKSRGYEDTPEKITRFSKEIEYMQKKWKTILEHDPCYSPNLTLKREDYSIKT